MSYLMYFKQMKEMLRGKFFILFAASLLMSAAFAESMYISDELEVPVRAGASDKYRVIKMLKSGTPISTLSKSGNYVLIKYDNSQGWVLSRHLMAEASARNQLASVRPLQEESRNLKQQITDAQVEQEKVRAQEQELRKQLAEKEQELITIRKTSANVIRIDEYNKELEELTAKLNAKLQTLQQENDRLKTDNRTTEWIFGGFLVFSGLILYPIFTWLISGSRKKRTRAWRG